MEQNEAGFQAPILCVNNCGFFGTVATMNMCSKCYKDTVLNQEHAKLAASSIESIVNGGKPIDVPVPSHDGSLESKAVTTQLSFGSQPENNGGENLREGPKRCSACRKRVGLTGFNCRCGNIFCALHRYSDKHDCPFDYQKAGQDAISKANPVVKAEKLDKI